MTNDVNKFIALLVLALLGLIFGMTTGCRSTKSSVERVVASTDSTVVVNGLVADSSKTSVSSDSVLHSTQTADTLYVYRNEVHDTLYKSFVDHYMWKMDSMAIHVDSVTGDVTYHYYKNVYEKEVVHDTLRIKDVVRDSVRESKLLKDSLRMAHEKIDSLQMNVKKWNSMYRATMDSINNNKVTVIEKSPSLWERLKSGLVAIVVVAFIIGLIYVAVKKMLKND